MSLHTMSIEDVRDERAGRMTQSPRSGVPWLKWLFWLATLTMVVVGLVLVGIATIPALFGYSTYTVDDASMEPKLRNGSAAVASATRSSDLEVGDVIVRREEAGGPAVLHRIVDIGQVGGERAFFTQADQNAAPDETPVTLSGEGDRVVYTVPYAGYILNFAESWTGRLMLIGVPLVLLSAPFLDHIRQRGPARSRRPSPQANLDPRPTPDAPATMQQRAAALRQFVRRHSGMPEAMVQCAKHPPITGMTTLQMLAALRTETGVVATSQRVAQTCAELGVPFEMAGPVAGRERVA